MKYEHPLRRQPLRDPSYSLADWRREEEALRTAVEMMAPEHRPLCAFPLGERGAEMLRLSTGVDAKALGRLLTVICVKEREQIWRREEEQ